MKISDVIRAKAKIAVCIALVLATAAVYWPVKDHDFVLLDDDAYIMSNPNFRKGFSPGHVACILTYCAPAEEANPWHPLTTFSLMLDHRLYGLRPAGYHVTNVVLHIANALFLFLIVARMTHAVWRSAFVAALFALHPLHVESVAWAAERKDVLSTLFGMLAIGAYVLYAERPKVSRYVAVCLFFALSLMAKTMLVTLPFVLLLFDFWPLKRLRTGVYAGGEDVASSARAQPVGKREARQKGGKPFISGEEAEPQGGLSLWFPVREKVPLFALSAAAAAMNLYSQAQLGAVDTATPLFTRIGNAVVSYTAYIVKMLRPVDLAVLYPYPETISLWKFAAALAFLALVTVFALRLARRLPWLFVGWSIYLGTLVPVIGIVQAGRQAMADRYTYFPLIGLFIIAAWGAALLARNLRYRAVLPAAAGTSLVLLSVAAGHQVALWKDGISLFEHTLAVTSGNGVIHRSLADTLSRAGRLDEAVAHYREAARLTPGDSEMWNNLGHALRRQGKDGEAFACFLKAVRANPDNVKALGNAGSMLASRGRVGEAAPYFEKALRIRPDDLESGIGRAEVLQATGRRDEALALYERMLLVHGDSAEVNYNAGTLLASYGRIDEALDCFRKAVTLKPGYAKAHNNLGSALMLKGRTDEAAVHLRAAVQLDPAFETAKANLAEALRIAKEREMVASPGR